MIQTTKWSGSLKKKEIYVSTCQLHKCLLKSIWQYKEVLNLV